jgi:hypothetical protein
LPAAATSLPGFKNLEGLRSSHANITETNLILKNSILVASLRACQAHELNALQRFVASPYFNRQAERVALLGHLLRFWPDFPSQDIQKEAVFAAIFPDKPFDDKQLRYLISDLNALIEQFWLVEKSTAPGRSADLTLLDCLEERGLEKSYRQLSRRFESRFEESLPRDRAFFYDRFRFAGLEEKRFARSRKRQFDKSIQDVAGYLDRYYYLERLRTACAMLDRQTILSGAYDPGLSAEWLQHLRERDFFGEPVIRLFYRIWQALSDEKDEARYRELRAELAAQAPDVPPEDLTDIYFFAINYCARKIRQGLEPFAAEALDLYTTGIERGILLGKGELSPWTFANVVKLSLRLKLFERVETFIRQYAPVLPVGYRENALHYNLAELFYYTKRPGEAQAHLNQVAYSDLNYYLGARVMLAKIYYESGDIEPLLSLLAAFIIFLKRNKELSGDLKETYLNFCDILFQLARRNPKKMAVLGEQIEKTTLLTDRGWLKEMFEKSLRLQV